MGEKQREKMGGGRIARKQVEENWWEGRKRKGPKKMKEIKRREIKYCLVERRSKRVRGGREGRQERVIK